ncbi:hypothetical protein EOK75_17195 (plasmid) [Pseudorhodobacter turbinis]|uniref:Uncharacterized protein n=1 Tax=Pseudorhodobacter turbinis TaxID=2500533 RepID=A0A4P8EKB7_9RHOB|nr:hypothetical protein [Pseudorhodobacter turbinis]QCO57449.1 hypothetical protein EOK75_17195 [Pseudorhodobacter turbinis]
MNTRKEYIENSINSRQAEIDQYQFAIDTYDMSLPLARRDPDLRDYEHHLSSMLKSTIIEQKKAKIMLQVLKTQREQLDDN